MVPGVDFVDKITVWEKVPEVPKFPKVPEVDIDNKKKNEQKFKSFPKFLMSLVFILKIQKC